MLLTPQILTGMSVGELSPTAILIPILSIISFFILEMIPHWDPEGEDGKKALTLRYVDFCLSIGLFLILSLLRQFNFKLVLGGVCSFAVYAFFYLLDSKKTENTFINKLIRIRKLLKYNDKSIWGILIQFSICVLCVALILNLVDFPTWARIKTNILINILRFSS